MPGPIHSFDRHRAPTGNASRRPLRGCRIGARQTSTPDPQSRTQACAQPAPGRSHYRRSVHLFHGPVPPSSFCHRSEACNSAASPHCAEETKVPHVVFFPARGLDTRPKSSSFGIDPGAIVDDILIVDRSVHLCRRICILERDNPFC